MIGLITSTSAAMTPEYKPAMPSFLRMLKKTENAVGLRPRVSPSTPFRTVSRV